MPKQNLTPPVWFRFSGRRRSESLCWAFALDALLFVKSFEYGEHVGLGLIPGQVTDLRAGPGRPDPESPPHGLEQLEILRQDPIFRYFRDGEYVYYVHSFYATGCTGNTLAVSQYGAASVTGVVRSGHVYGTQFHPEKSGDAGLRLLKAFSEL